jgi:hypothetical protein
MIRFKEFNEQFVNTMVMKGGTRPGQYDMFVNPTKKELREIESQSFQGYGFRFMADFKEKKIYMWSNEVVHQEMIEKNQSLFPQIIWKEYWHNADEADRYISGHIDSGQIKSDVWRSFGSRFKAAKGDGTRIGLQRAPFYNMEMNDFKWLSKYIDPKETKKLVTDITRHFK